MPSGGFRSFVALLRLVFIAGLIGLTLCAADVSVKGRVLDEDQAPVRAAQVTFRAAGASTSAPPAEWQAQTDPDGAFRLSLPAPGDFLVTVEREGYYALKDRPLHFDSSQEVVLTVNTLREVFQSENVNASSSPLDVAGTQNQERLSGTEINDLPFANSHSLRNSLQSMPGVLEDASGALHVNGSSENQILYPLNGFNLTNPISGQFQTALAGGRQRPDSALLEGQPGMRSNASIQFS